MINLLTIEELSRTTGIPRRTIHFYVQQGLLPAPTGAGLGARYTQEHVQRLKAIPVLRNEGLRLDEIRERFSTMSDEEIASLVPPCDTALYQADITALVSRLVKNDMQYKIAEVDESLRTLILPPLPPHGEEYLHYHYSQGITIIVPREVAQNQRVLLAALLRRAAELFGDAKMDNS